MSQPASPVRVPAARVALATSSVYPGGGCAYAFELAARLGFDGVEVLVWNDQVSQDAAALERLRDHYGVPVLAVHAPTLLITQRVWGREPWPKLEQSCELAARLDANTVVVHPPFRWQREYAAGFAVGVRDLHERSGVRLAVENMFPWRARGREVLAYHPGWDPLPHPFEHVTLDLSHTATSGTDAVAMARDLGERLVHLHLADGLGTAKDEHLVPGRGSQPCAEVLGLLADQGWTETVVVEINTRRCRSQAERELDIEQSLAFARLHLAAPAFGGRTGLIET